MQDIEVDGLAADKAFGAQPQSRTRLTVPSL
jgi:hypothetical protein